MLRLLADENPNVDGLRTLLLLRYKHDVVRALDVGLSGIELPGILAWAAEDSRNVLTYDARLWMSASRCRREYTRHMIV